MSQLWVNGSQAVEITCEVCKETWRVSKEEYLETPDFECPKCKQPQDRIEERVNIEK